MINFTKSSSDDSNDDVISPSNTTVFHHYHSCFDAFCYCHSYFIIERYCDSDPIDDVQTFFSVHNYVACFKGSMQQLAQDTMVIESISNQYTLTTKSHRQLPQNATKSHAVSNFTQTSDHDWSIDPHPQRYVNGQAK